MRGRIRDFTDGDYEATVAVHNVVFSDWPEAAGDWRHHDETRDPKCKWKRFVYEEEGRIIAYGGFSQTIWMYHPRKFWTWVVVHPEHRRRGIGQALYDHVMRELAPHEPISVRNEVNEAYEDGIRFAEKQGFKAGMREQESILDLTKFDPASFAEDLGQVETGGIKIMGYAELSADPECHRKLWELDAIVSPDMPSPDPITPPDFERYCKQILEHPRFLADGFMAALDGERYVGMSNLWSTEVKDKLHTGLTGVLREYRKQGIATALKILTLAKVKKLGYKSVMTWNDSTNERMLGINWRLGFEKRPVWIDYEKILGTEEG